MKVGDLVKMKYEKDQVPGHQAVSRSIRYTDSYGILYGIIGRGVKVLMPDNTIKLGLIKHWEVISEIR